MCARARVCGHGHRSASPTQTGTERQLVHLIGGSFLEGFLPFSLEGAWFGDRKASIAFHRGQPMNFASLRDGMGCIYKEVNKRAYGRVIWGYWDIGKSWEFGRCLTLGCRTWEGHCPPAGCVSGGFLKRSLVACGMR